ncbi:hypothetical protein PO909_003566 [Leuciscus waleckii]
MTQGEIEFEMEQESEASKAPEATVGSNSSVVNASTSGSSNIDVKGENVEEEGSEAFTARSVACANTSGSSNSIKDNEVDMPITANISLHEHPTDMGHFPEYLDSNVKRFIVSSGSCKPTGPLPRDPAQDNRSFTMAYYVCNTEDMAVLLPHTRCSLLRALLAFCQVNMEDKYLA